MLRNDQTVSGCDKISANKIYRQMA